MERAKMKKKGFTLVELLVVIAIIAMLLAILMPALGKVRQLAQRMICGTNLSGIGKAMMVYSNDDEYDSFPIAYGTYLATASGTGVTGGAVSDWYWDCPDAPGTGNNIPSSSGGTGTPTVAVTVSANFYLLVKYADVSPAQFLCAGGDERKFELSNYKTKHPSQNNVSAQSITDVWDFGSPDNTYWAQGYNRPTDGHNSYSFQLPVKVTNNPLAVAYPVSTTSPADAPMAADRNPFFKVGSVAKEALMATGTGNIRDLDKTTIQQSNSTHHQGEGQNVLYVDSHVSFEKQSNCGIDNDNIYTVWGQATIDPTNNPGDDELKQCGSYAGNAPSFDGSSSASLTDGPQNPDDSFLVNDYN